jgi:hypothetical protein
MLKELFLFNIRNVCELSILLFSVSIRKYDMSLLNLSNVKKCFKWIIALYNMVHHITG